MNVADLPTFWKYYKIDNSPQTTMLPKFIMYVSHDEILGAFFRALGWSEHVKGAKPASLLQIEFYVNKSTSQGT